MSLYKSATIVDCWHTLSGRKRTPNSTKGYALKIRPSARGETESSAPQKPSFRSFVLVIILVCFQLF